MLSPNFNPIRPYFCEMCYLIPDRVAMMWPTSDSSLDSFLAAERACALATACPSEEVAPSVSRLHSHDRQHGAEIHRGQPNQQQQQSQEQSDPFSRVLQAPQALLQTRKSDEPNNLTKATSK
ncbi:unnamed protein product, partial [Protopolystoma xenopodis]